MGSKDCLDIGIGEHVPHWPFPKVVIIERMAFAHPLVPLVRFHYVHVSSCSHPGPPDSTGVHATNSPSVPVRVQRLEKSLEVALSKAAREPGGR